MLRSIAGICFYAMVAPSGCEVIMPSHMEQEISAAEKELAALVARYLEKRGLKKTFTKFLKEAKLVDRLENSKEDLEAIYTSYMSGIKSASCKKKKAKKDLLGPLQKKAKLVEGISSVDNQSVADKTDVKNGGEVDFVEGDRSVVLTMPEETQSSLALNFVSVTQEPSRLTKKFRKAKGPVIGSIPPQDPCYLVDKHRARQILNECVFNSVKSIGNREHATVNKASQNLTCSSKHLEEPGSGKEKGNLVQKKKHKRSADRVKGVELSTEKKVAQTSSDNDSRFKKQQLHSEKAPSSMKVPLSSSKSLNGIPTFDAALDSNVLLENGKGSTSKKKSELDSDAGKSGMVEAKSYNGQHSEGPPLVITQLDNGSEDGIRKSKQPEVIGVRAFQRVKLEEVTFADPRLQNNSYWAKDGAEIGWGAKAEEVLGQVKGRDFRHEKTKKKRGSYKGGAIDLHSRSVKFSYSDEE